MEIVSDAFKTAAKADERETKALVEFIVNNQPYASGTTVASSTEADISNKDSIIESIHFTDKIASFEEDRFLLDGSYFLPVRDAEYCFWSDDFAKADGTFDTNPFVEITMPSPVYVDKITVLFCQEEYAEEYKVIVDDVTTITVDNGSNVIEIDDTISKIKIEIVKWFKPNWRAKIMAVDLGITKLYNDDDIIDIDLTEQMDFMGLTLPSNETTITLNNLSGEFDILNPSGFYEDISKDAPVNVRMGFVTDNGVELIEMGRFLLNSIEQKDNQLTLRASDIVSRLDNYFFKGWGYSEVQEEYLNAGDFLTNNYTIQDVIFELFSKLGLTSYLRFRFEDELEITVNGTDGWYSLENIKTARDLISRICLYYNLNCYVDRQGFITFDYIKPWDNNDMLDEPNWKSVLFYITPFKGYVYNQPTGQKIEINQSYTFPKMEENERLEEVLYKSDFYYTSGDRQVIVTGNTYSVFAGSDIIIPLSKFATQTANFVGAIVKTGTADIVDLEIYDYELVVKTSGTGTLQFEIDDVLVGITRDSFFNFDLRNFLTNKEGYNLQLNFARYRSKAIFNGEQQAFTDFFLSDFWSAFNMTCDWRQDLSNNLGDIVEVETKFGDNKLMIITEQNFKYNGALKGITKGVIREKELKNYTPSVG